MQKSFLFGVAGFLLGVVLVTVLDTTPPAGVPSPTPITVLDHSKDKMSMVAMMDAMLMNLEGKTGDEFDKVFLSDMIIHHQGAIDMATLATSSAKHGELKTLASEIIKAQTKEIEQMRQWQEEWKY